MSGAGRLSPAGVCAGQQKQLIDQAGKAQSFAVSIGQHSVSLSRRDLIDVAKQEGQIALDGGKRRAQFVRCVGNKALLSYRRAFDGCQHIIKGIDDASHLIVSWRTPYPVAQSTWGLALLRVGGNQAGRSNQVRKGAQGVAYQ